MNIELVNLDHTIFKKLISNSDKSKTLRVIYADHNSLNYIYSEQFDDRDFEGITFYPGSLVLFFVLRYYYKQKVKYLNLTDNQNELLNFALHNKKKILFFGDRLFVLEKIKTILKEKGHNEDFMFFIDGYDYDTETVLGAIRKFSPDIVFVGLGVGRQEKWIMANKQSLESYFCLAVGGWFQYLALEKKRAPLWMRQVYLEWMHKFFSEIKRVWHRYIFGIPLFVFRIYFKRIILTIKNL